MRGNSRPLCCPKIIHLTCPGVCLISTKIKRENTFLQRCHRTEVAVSVAFSRAPLPGPVKPQADLFILRNNTTDVN